jgi:hypothetical protein
MDTELLDTLRTASLVDIWSTLNTLACKQQAEASKGLSFFMKPRSTLHEGDMTQELFRTMTKEERLLWQRSKEEERRLANAAAGIDGAALLTKENVELWKSQGMTYAAMARDILGLPQERVAAITKSHNRIHPIQAKLKKQQSDH